MSFWHLGIFYFVGFQFIYSEYTFDNVYSREKEHEVVYVIVG